MLKPYYQDKDIQIFLGDCREMVPQLGLITGIVTDPPYELGFMGKAWDKQGISFQPGTWRILREVCKPGAMLLSFGGTRTFHRIAVAIEDAGWELRDTITYWYDNSIEVRNFIESLSREQKQMLEKAMPADNLLAWVYGSGFPKSLDISKAIDKQAGAERKVSGQYQYPDGSGERRVAPCNSQTTIGRVSGSFNITLPATPEAQLWSGYGTALKPAYEPILVCMNPIDGTFANNALKHGVAGLNIDGSRIGIGGDYTVHNAGSSGSESYQWNKGERKESSKDYKQTQGRFPANIIHDGSDEVLELFPNSKSTGGSGEASQYPKYDGRTVGSYLKGKRANAGGLGDSGSAARFFKTCEMTELELLFCRANAIMEVWKQNFVSIANNLSNLSSQHAVSALGHAVIVGSRGDKVLNDVSGLSMSVTPNELKTLAEMLIIAILSSESEHLQGQLQGEPTPSGCRVRFAEVQKQTDTTTIMISHWKSDGSAEPATFSIMPIYLAIGVRGSEFSRFKYCAKASKSERNAGCEGLEERDIGHNRFDTCEICGGTIFQNPDRPSACKCENPVRKHNTVKGNVHPTVKPLALMKYLVKLISPPKDAVLLDPFMGSGSTLVACKELGIKCIGIDTDEYNCEIAAKRCQAISQGVMELGI